MKVHGNTKLCLWKKCKIRVYIKSVIKNISWISDNLLSMHSWGKIEIFKVRCSSFPHRVKRSGGGVDTLHPKHKHSLRNPPKCPEETDGQRACQTGQNLEGTFIMKRDFSSEKYLAVVSGAQSWSISHYIHLSSLLCSYFFDNTLMHWML